MGRRIGKQGRRTSISVTFAIIRHQNELNRIIRFLTPQRGLNPSQKYPAVLGVRPGNDRPYAPRPLNFGQVGGGRNPMIRFSSF
jgi:hypothetical protein